MPLLEIGAYVGWMLCSYFWLENCCVAGSHSTDTAWLCGKNLSGQIGYLGPAAVGSHIAHVYICTLSRPTFTLLGLKRGQDESLGAACVCVSALCVCLCYLCGWQFTELYYTEKCLLGTHAQPHSWLDLGCEDADASQLQDLATAN